MLKKRIIPCLDIKDNRTVKGTNFKNLRDAGDPVEMARRYSQEGADELVFLDISASNEKRKTLVHLVEKIARSINIPFTVGGGISNENIASELLYSGADKISINSAAVYEPNLIEKLAEKFGSQCITVAIDSKSMGLENLVFTHGGSRATNLKTIEWAKQVVTYGAGEILLTSMDHDGQKNGFAESLLDQVTQAVNVPVIASGGGGSCQHFLSLFKNTKVSAGLAASIFHYQEISIPYLKQFLKNNSIPVRCN